MDKWFETVDVSSIDANKAWRKAARLRAERDMGYRKAVRWQCARDMNYFLNAWSFVQETRADMDEWGNFRPRGALPFLTRPHQAEYIRIIEAALGIKSIGVKKCREEGFSWLLVQFALRDLIFKNDYFIGLCSATKDKSDTPGDMKSLGGKMEWAISKLPRWMLGQRGKRVGDGDWIRQDCKFLNQRRNNSITFDAATGEGPRSGRYGWYGFDEIGTSEWWRDSSDRKAMEAISSATPSKWYVSTPEGQDNEFYRVMTAPSDSIVKIEMNWRDNAEKARGLYYYNNGNPIAAEGHTLHPDYNPPTERIQKRWNNIKLRGFDLNKGTRSPFYDRECDEANATPESIAKNVDADWGGSVTKIFDDQFFRVCTETSKTPEIRGTLTVASDFRTDWSYDNNGQFHLWCQLNASGKPPMGRYAIGMDLGHGRGGSYGSNSVIQVVDLVHKIQVMEFASNIIDPKTFAHIGLGVAKWFHDAYFAWERNQPGNLVIDVVREAGYSNYYMGRKLDVMTREATAVPGFHTNDTTKEKMFADILLAVKLGDVVVRSRALVEEFGQYVRDPKNKNKIKHTSNDASHGDRVMAFGVAIQAMRDRPAALKETSDKPWGDGPPPPGTLAWRMWKHEQERSSRDNDWDDRTTADLLQGGGMTLQRIGNYYDD
jgi:hypothetical protein